MSGDTTGSVEGTVTDMSKAFYYNASATPFGGTLTHASQPGPIPTIGSASLSQAGGIVEGVPSGSSIEGIGVTNACSKITGTEGLSGWCTELTSSVSGLDILGIVTAKELTCTMKIVHPLTAPPYYPCVSFDLHCDDLRVNGISVTPDTCQRGQFYRTEAEVAARQCSWLDDVEMMSKVQAQTETTLSAADCPDWMGVRYGWMKKANCRREKGHDLCSLVTGFNPVNGIKSYGHVLDLPNLGFLFFGELMVDHTSFGVTLLRAEICPERTRTSRKDKPPIGGTVAVAAGHTKGSSSP